MMACYLDFLVRGESNDSDEKNKIEINNINERGVKQGASSG